MDDEVREGAGGHTDDDGIIVASVSCPG
jgi:hypothetical protein